MEQIRAIYDQGDVRLILIGMSGLEKKLPRYPQLYSRVGFAHQYKPLSVEEAQFILQYHWQKLGLALDAKNFSDNEEMLAIIRITNGNFRLIQRIFRQIERILIVNGLKNITKEVVEAARKCLVIGNF